MEVLCNLSLVALTFSSAAVPWSEGPVLGSWGFALRKGPMAIELFSWQQRFVMDIITFLLFLGLATSIISLLAGVILYIFEQQSSSSTCGTCSSTKVGVIHYARAGSLISVAVVEVAAAIVFVYGLVFSSSRLYLGGVGPGLYVAVGASLLASLSLTLSRQPGGGGGGSGGVILEPPPTVTTTTTSLPIARIAGASGVIAFGSAREQVSSATPVLTMNDTPYASLPPSPPPPLHNSDGRIIRKVESF